MKVFIQMLMVSTLAFIAQIIFPWWVVVFVAGLIAFFLNSGPWVSFFAGFLGVAVLWISVSLYLDLDSNSLLSQKVASLIGIGSHWNLILITGLVGGLCGGMGAVIGYQVKQFVLFFNEPST